MNKCILIIIFALGFKIETFAQKEFVLEVTDSLHKSSSLIYSETKKFILKKCNSYSPEIKFEDIKSGIIVFNGITSQTINIISDYTCSYRFTTAFFIKDQHVRVKIDNVLYMAESSSSSITPLNAYLGESEKSSYELGIFKSKADALMADLRKEFQEMINSYLSYVKMTSKNYFFERLNKS